MVDTAILLEMVSRTFALSIRYLPGRLQETVALAYLLFRVSDCMEDYAGIEPARKIQLLSEWEQVLLGNGVASVFVDHLSDMDANDPEVHVALQAPELVAMLNELPMALREKIVRYVVETTAGMAKWQKKGPMVDDIAELDEYMYYVAGLVGYLITEIFAWYSSSIGHRKERLLPLSRHSGLGLPTVNIIRGLRKDYERGWVFVPRSILETHGLTADGLFKLENEEKALQVVDKLADKAEIHLRFRGYPGS